MFCRSCEAVMRFPMAVAYVPERTYVKPCHASAVDRSIADGAESPERCWHESSSRAARQSGTAPRSRRLSAPAMRLGAPLARPAHGRNATLRHGFLAEKFAHG